MNYIAAVVETKYYGKLIRYYYAQGHQESQCPAVPTVCPECERKDIPRAQVSFPPHVMESKTVLDSGSQAVDFGFQVVDSSQCQWSLDCGFQSLVGFRIPQAKMSGVLESGFPYMELHGANIY